MRKPIRSSEMFFFSDDTPTPEIYTLSLHDALPISKKAEDDRDDPHFPSRILAWAIRVDRKSTRLNSSHVAISYAVFCLKKKRNRRRGPVSIRALQLLLHATSAVLAAATGRPLHVSD